MNQALYAHMNNKRKMKKKKRTGVAFLGEIISDQLYGYMNICKLLAIGTQK
jgi:hypothetical protein